MQAKGCHRVERSAGQKSAPGETQSSTFLSAASLRLAGSKDSLQCMEGSLSTVATIFQDGSVAACVHADAFLMFVEEKERA